MQRRSCPEPTSQPRARAAYLCEQQYSFPRASEKLDEDLTPVWSVSHFSADSSRPQRAARKRQSPGLTSHESAWLERHKDVLARYEMPRGQTSARNEHAHGESGYDRPASWEARGSCIAQGCVIGSNRFGASLLSERRHVCSRRAVSGELSAAKRGQTRVQIATLLRASQWCREPCHTTIAAASEATCARQLVGTAWQGVYTRALWLEEAVAG